MISRRSFLKGVAATGGLLALDARHLFPATFADDTLRLNSFIESHPDAVFILRTDVDSETNSSAILDVGRKFGATLFETVSPRAAGSVDDTTVVIKPNITWWSWDIPPAGSVLGIHTDPNFVEGIIGRLTDLSILPENIYIREANYHGPDSPDGNSYGAMAKRTGVVLEDLNAGVGNIPTADLQWSSIDNGVWFKRIPYLWPVNVPGNRLINIAKFKSHLMGMTLCAKNLQGTIAPPYVAHCTAWGTDMTGVDSQDVVPDAFTTIEENYNRHVNAGIPRWDLPGNGSGGIWMETWASRCLDNNATLTPMINIIEGIYGREGPFVSGPDDGYGEDFLTNIVIFGKNSFHVDIIGTYLAGHEPGNFGLFHMAMERQLSKYLNPADIPLYEWKLDGEIASAPLSAFSRTAIRTPYLQKAGEPQYHMVNEPYSYATAVKSPAGSQPSQPDVFALSQNFPNPFNPSTSIRFYVPEGGNVLIEIFDVKGSRVAVLVDGYQRAGEHVSVWSSTRVSSGMYFYRMSYKGVTMTKEMVLLR